MGRSTWDVKAAVFAADGLDIVITERTFQTRVIVFSAILGRY